MKKIFFFFLFVPAAGIIFSNTAFAQIRLQQAVVSEVGGSASNGTTRLNYTIGQAAAGKASNGSTAGEFGYWNSATGVTTVATPKSTGAIQSMFITQNPGSSTVNINVTLLASQQLDLQLFEVSGRLVSTLYSRRAAAGKIIAPFDTRSLASGVYFVAARVPGALLQAQLDVYR